MFVEVEADADGVLTYQWYSGAENNTANGSAIEGATEASYTPPTAELGVVYYYVTVNSLPSGGGAGDAATSSAVCVEVNNLVNAALPAVSIYTGQTEYCVGDSAEPIAAAVTDGGRITITWYKNGENSNTGGVNVGFGREYTPSTGTAGTFYYYFTAVNAIPDNGDGGVKSQSAASATVAITVIEPIHIWSIHNVSELQAFFEQAGDSGASAAEPCVLQPVIWEDDGGWNALFETINAAGKYVALDMSTTPVDGASPLPAAFSFGCGNTTNARAGKGLVVSFILPDGINTISEGVESEYGVFADFTAIKTMSGAGVVTIGNLAFYGCTSLRTVNLPNVGSIGERAFKDSGNEALAVTLGQTPPVLGIRIFEGCGEEEVTRRTVTVNIPAGTTSYGDLGSYTIGNYYVNFWVKALLGMGCLNNDGNYETIGIPTSDINGNITVILQELSVPE